MPKAEKRPSWLPVIFSLVAVLLSTAIIAIPATRSSGLIYLGYLLTPLAPIAMLVWARTKDNLGRTSIFYDIGTSEKILKFVSGLSVIGFVLAVAVVWEIASRWSQR
jgi:hypothetical protein